jgi:hypothetical protein
VSRRRQITAWLHIATSAFIAGTIGALWACTSMLAPTFEGNFIPELVALEGAAAIALLRGREWGVALVGVSAIQLVVFLIGTVLASTRGGR